MSDPNELFRRVRRRQAALSRPPEQTRVPAPAPAGGTAPVAPPAAPEPPARPAGPQAVPSPVRPAGGHALYSRLMRSHDRMGTRHLPPNG